MPRRVVSLLQRGPAALRASDPVLEANAYAVAADLDLTVVLVGEGVELAVAGADVVSSDLAGAALPRSAGALDLQGLVESGIDVYALADDVVRRGLDQDELVPGVHLAGRERVDDVLRDAETVLNW